MATLILIALIAWLVFGKKETGRTGRQKKTCQFMLIVIIAVFDIAILIAYLCNIYLAPNEISKAKEETLPIEQKIEALISDFSYIPSKDSRQKLDKFLDEYTILANESKIVNEEIARHERRANRHSSPNKLAGFFIDFGLFTNR